LVNPKHRRKMIRSLAIPSESQIRLILLPAISVQSMGVSEIGMGRERVLCAGGEDGCERTHLREKSVREALTREKDEARPSEDGGAVCTVQEEARTRSSTSKDHRSRCMSAKSRAAASRVKSYSREGRIESARALRLKGVWGCRHLEATLRVSYGSNAQSSDEQVERVHEEVANLGPLERLKKKFEGV
jgi:hypothetical protein